MIDMAIGLTKKLNGKNNPTESQLQDFQGGRRSHLLVTQSSIETVRKTWSQNGGENKAEIRIWICLPVAELGQWRSWLCREGRCVAVSERTRHYTATLSLPKA